jgi:hypothetical protein
VCIAAGVDPAAVIKRRRPGGRVLATQHVQGRYWHLPL